MGRGRAKAKQQKVARDLKYNTPNTDLDSLQRELGGGAGYLSSPATRNGSAGVDVDGADPADRGRDDLGADDPGAEDDWAATPR